MHTWLHVSARDWTQAFLLAQKALYPLGHLPVLKGIHFNTTHRSSPQLIMVPSCSVWLSDAGLYPGTHSVQKTESVPMKPQRGQLCRRRLLSSGGLRAHVCVDSSCDTEEDTWQKPLNFSPSWKGKYGQFMAVWMCCGGFSHHCGSGRRETRSQTGG